MKAPDLEVPPIPEGYSRSALGRTRLFLQSFIGNAAQATGSGPCPEEGPPVQLDTRTPYLPKVLHNGATYLHL